MTALTPLILLFCLQLVASGEIPLKTTFISVPEIEASYSVVKSTIYPTDRFAQSLGHDFYVTKAMKNRPKELEQPSQHSPQSSGNENRVDSTPIVQQQTNLKKDIGLSQAKATGASMAKAQKAVESGSLNGNGNELIPWKMKISKPISESVVENGVPKAITKAVPILEEFIEYAEEGIEPTEGPPPRPTPKMTAQPGYLTQAVPARIQPPNKTKTVEKKEERKEPAQQKSLDKLYQTEKDKLEGQRFESHQKVLIILATCFLILMLIFILVRSQKNETHSRLQILHSGLDNYREDDEDASIFNQRSTEDNLSEDDNLADNDLEDGSWSDSEEDGQQNKQDY